MRTPLPLVVGLQLAVILSSCDGRPAPGADVADACLGPPGPAQPLACFQACARDSDCVAVWPPGPCVCVPWTVNRDSRRIVEEKARLEAPARVDGGAHPGCGCWACTGRPGCADGRCEWRLACSREPDPSR
jgi:hypothetical protein